MFTKDQRVICVNADIHPSLWEYVKPLRKDGIYMIRDVVPGISPFGEEGNVTVYLHEIHNTINEHGIERGYNSERFAPIQEQDEESFTSKSEEACV